LHYFVGYFATALLLGGIIGAERQWHQRIAGLRTNALVSGGAAMFVSISHLVPLNPTSLQVCGPSRLENWLPGGGGHHARRTQHSRTEHGRYALVLGGSRIALRAALFEKV
jgi:hypothetical protein